MIDEPCLVSTHCSIYHNTPSPIVLPVHARARSVRRNCGEVARDAHPCVLQLTLIRNCSQDAVTLEFTNDVTKANVAQSEPASVMYDRGLQPHGCDREFVGSRCSSVNTKRLYNIISSPVTKCMSLGDDGVLNYGVTFNYFAPRVRRHVFSANVPPRSRCVEPELWCHDWQYGSP